MARERKRLLLEANHAFPGPYGFRAFVRPESREVVLDAVRALDGLQIQDVGDRSSSTGKWLSLHIHVHVETADVVLDVYEALHALDEVKMTL